MSDPWLIIVKTRERDDAGKFLDPYKRERDLLWRAEQLINQGWIVKGFAVHYGGTEILMQRVERDPDE